MGKNSSPPLILIEPPGPKAREILERDSKLISPSYVRYYPLVVDRIEGTTVIDVDGNKYIDFNSGLLCLNIGHHKKVIEAIKKQAEKLIHYSITDFYYREAVELAEKLVKIVPISGEKRMHMGNSGAEAIETALKVVRWKTRRPYIIAFIGGFHGRTYGAMSLTASKPVQRRGFSPLLPGIIHVPYGYCYRCPFKLEYPNCDIYCVDFIEEEILSKYIPPDEIAAIFFEPVQGEGGYIWPPEGYFQKIRKLADKYGILLVDDEVQTGIGRTGKWFAIEHWGVEPDVITIAKSIASGLPLSITVTKKEIMSWEKGSHATTFGGNPVACRAAIETLSVIAKEKLTERALKLGNEIIKILKEEQEKSKIIGDVRGKGFMIGIEIVSNKKTKTPGNKIAKEIINKAWKKGLLIITAGKSTIRIAPPLNIPEEHLIKGLEILITTLKEVEKYEHF